MVAVRRFLNSFWKHESEGRIWFDPDRDTAYPDRVRRRPPGANSAGLSPHTDSGSIERWLLPAYQRVFRHIYAGDWAGHDPWDGAFRSEVHEFRSTVMCSAFRTFQGWTALSDMQPDQGVLHAVPIPAAMGYVTCCCAPCRTTSPTMTCAARSTGSPCPSPTGITPCSSPR